MEREITNNANSTSMQDINLSQYTDRYTNRGVWTPANR